MLQNQFVAAVNGNDLSQHKESSLRREKKNAPHYIDYENSKRVQTAWKENIPLLNDCWLHSHFSEYKQVHAPTQNHWRMLCNSCFGRDKENLKLVVNLWLTITKRLCKTLQEAIKLDIHFGWGHHTSKCMSWKRELSIYQNDWFRKWPFALAKLNSLPAKM